MILANPLIPLTDDSDQEIRSCAMYNGRRLWKRVLLLLRQRRLTNDSTRAASRDEVTTVGGVDVDGLTDTASVPACRSGEELWRTAFSLVHQRQPMKSCEADSDTCAVNVRRPARQLWARALCLAHQDIATRARPGGMNDAATCRRPLKRRHTPVAESTGNNADSNRRSSKYSRVQQCPKELWRNAFSLVYKHVDDQRTRVPNARFSPPSYEQCNDTTDQSCIECGNETVANTITQNGKRHNSGTISIDSHCAKTLWKRAITLAATEARWRCVVDQTQPMLGHISLKANIDSHCPKTLWKRAITLAAMEAKWRRVVHQTHSSCAGYGKGEPAITSQVTQEKTIFDSNPEGKCPKALWQRAIALAESEVTRSRQSRTDTSCGQ